MKEFLRAQSFGKGGAYLLLTTFPGCCMLLVHLVNSSFVLESITGIVTLFVTIKVIEHLTKSYDGAFEATARTFLYVFLIFVTTFVVQNSLVAHDVIPEREFPEFMHFFLGSFLASGGFVGYKLWGMEVIVPEGKKVQYYTSISLVCASLSYHSIIQDMVWYFGTLTIWLPAMIGFTVFILLFSDPVLRGLKEAIPFSNTLGVLPVLIAFLSTCTQFWTTPLFFGVTFGIIVKTTSIALVAIATIIVMWWKRKSLPEKEKKKKTTPEDKKILDAILKKAANKDYITTWKEVLWVEDKYGMTKYEILKERFPLLDLTYFIKLVEDPQKEMKVVDEESFKAALVLLEKLFLRQYSKSYTAQLLNQLNNLVQCVAKNQEVAGVEKVKTMVTDNCPAIFQALALMSAMMSFMNQIEITE